MAGAFDDDDPFAALLADAVDTGQNLQSLTGGSSSASALAVPGSDALAEAPQYEEVEIPDDVFPEVQSIACSVHLRQELDLKTVAFKGRNCEYNPRKVNAVIMRLREPKTTALVYSSGKVRLNGARTEADAKLACKKVARLIQKIGYPDVKFADFTIDFMVATADVRFPVRLECLALEHRQFCSYEPEISANLCYRMLDPKVCFLVFVSGKLLINGAKSMDDITKAFKSLYPVLYKYSR